MKRQYRAVNRFITKIKSTSSIDGVSSSWTFQVSDTTVSWFSLPQWACTFYVTADFAQTWKEEIFRIVNVSWDTLTYDKRISVGWYVKPAHTFGASIRINDVADIINDMSESIDNFGLISQIDGTQTVKVWWGVFNNMGTVYNVSSSTLAITWGQLSDNTTNYIHLVLSTQLFTVTASSTLAGAICMGSVVTSGGVIWTITDLRPAFSTTYWEIPTKLDKTGWLRDWMGASRQTLEIDATGAEVKKAIVDGSSITSDETIRKRKADWTYEEIPYSVLENNLSSGSFPSYIAWESMTQWDAVAIEYFWNIGLINNSSIDVWNISANTRAYQTILWSGVSMTTLITTSVKVWTPTDTWTMTIETDDGTWKPSWTLANVNATATIPGASFGIWTDNTWTFAWAFTLTLWTKYHVVIKRQNAVDPSNYVTFNVKTKNTRIQWQGLHNGTSYQTATFTAPLAIYSAGILDKYLIKASASFLETAKIVGFAKDTAIWWDTVIVSNIKWTTWLIEGKYYFLSNTAWAVSLTPWTIKSIAWFSKGTTSLLYTPAIYNPLWADATTLNLWTYSVTNSTLVKDFIFSDYGKLVIWASWACNFWYRTDWVTTQAFVWAWTYTITFEPNKVYTISMVWTWGTWTFTFARTYPFNHANLLY